MKNLTFLFGLSLLSLHTALHAQKGFAYQAILRDTNGELITNEEIDVYFTIIKDDDSACDGNNGVVVYKEEHEDILLNEFGLLTLSVGEGEPEVPYDFAQVPWKYECLFLKVEVKREGAGQPIVSIGTSSILNAPKAIYALNAETTDRTPEYKGPATYTFPGTSITAQLEQSYVWEQNHHLYLLFTTNQAINWIQAQKVARKAGGHLVTVTSADENNFILTNILTHPKAQGDVPIGLTDILWEGHYEWVTGEIALTGNSSGSVFYYWQPGQPTNTGAGGENVAHYYAQSFAATRGWNDINADVPYFQAIIVEFEFITSP